MLVSGSNMVSTEIEAGEGADGNTGEVVTNSIIGGGADGVCE